MSNNNYHKLFAENLLALREYKKLTKTQAAAELGIHRETYAAYESGARVPSFAATASIAAFFQVDLSDMLQKESKEIIAEKEYYDARHVCWAYMLGPQRTDFRSNDNGEPSGTAGKPILGQINSAGLTDILIVVVRYFGGIKLGTSGLIVAYREAASEAIAANEIIERQVEDEVHFGFEYPLMNEVMRIVKEEGPTIVSQIFDMDCEMTLRIRRSLMDNLKKRLSKVDGVHFINEE